jgi:hypothetical protein
VKKREKENEKEKERALKPVLVLFSQLLGFRPILVLLVGRDVARQALPQCTFPIPIKTVDICSFLTIRQVQHFFIE